MLKKKLILSGLSVFILVLMLSVQVYRANYQHQAVYADFIRIYTLHKDMGRLQLLVQEIDRKRKVLPRIKQQWQQLYSHIRQEIIEVGPGLHLKAAHNPISYQSIGVMLEELDKDYRLLIKSVEDSQAPPMSANVIALKLSAELTNLTSYVETHAKQLTQELTTLRKSQDAWVLLMVIAILLILIFVSLNVQRLILIPINQLLASIQAFGAGALETRSSIKQADEVGLLAASFNAMAARIEHSFTTEKGLREHLQASQEKLVEANRLARLGHWHWDLRTDRHTWSAEIFDIYGRDRTLSPSDYPSVQQYFSPGSWEELARHVEACRAQGTPYKVEAKVTRPDGEIRFIAARGNAIKEGNAVVALYGTVQDITEMKQREEELAISEEKYRLAMEATRGGLWDWDLENHRMDYSPRWLGIVGETAVKPDIGAWESRIHPDDRSGVINSLQQYLEGAEGLWREEHRVARSDGNWVWVVARARWSNVMSMDGPRE